MVFLITWVFLFHVRRSRRIYGISGEEKENVCGKRENLCCVDATVRRAGRYANVFASLSMCPALNVKSCHCLKPSFEEDAITRPTISD